jgi:hypothetical protein
VSLQLKCACGTRAYDSQAAAERALAKIQSLALRSEMPTDVVKCGRDQWHIADPMPSATLIRATEIGPMSSRRKAENKVRRAVALATFGRNPRCARPGCTSMARDVHEPLTRARGGSITDPANMVPLCGPCHSEIQQGPDWAYDLGLMEHSWGGAA